MQDSTLVARLEGLFLEAKFMIKNFPKRSQYNERQSNTKKKQSDWRQPTIINIAETKSWGLSALKNKIIFFLAPLSLIVSSSNQSVTKI